VLSKTPPEMQTVLQPAKRNNIVIDAFKKEPEKDPDMVCSPFACQLPLPAVFVPFCCPHLWTGIASYLSIHPHWECCAVGNGIRVKKKKACDRPCENRIILKNQTKAMRHSLKKADCAIAC
jgi:hypothetical protein